MRKLKLEELNRLNPQEFEKKSKLPLTVVLDNIRSMQNVGSIFRTADGFAIESIQLCGITAKPPHRDIHRSALGATETVNWSYHENVLECCRQLKNQGYLIVGLEQTNESLLMTSAWEKFQRRDKIALILGNEVEGISEELIPILDFALEIPQEGTKHSFNVSVAAGMAMWWFYDKMKAL